MTSFKKVPVTSVLNAEHKQANRIKVFTVRNILWLRSGHPRRRPPPSTPFYDMQGNKKMNR